MRKIELLRPVLCGYFTLETGSVLEVLAMNSLGAAIQLDGIRFVVPVDAFLCLLTTAPTNFQRRFHFPPDLAKRRGFLRAPNVEDVEACDDDVKMSFTS